MAATEVSQQDAAPEPSWGMADAAVGWVVAFVAASVLGGLIVAVAGYKGNAAKAANLPLTMIALTTIPLWIGFVGAPVLAATRKGNGIVRDFGARIRAVDVPIGVLAGLASQLVLPLLFARPLIVLLHKSDAEVGKPAKELAAKAHNHLGVLLLVLVVVIGAPIAEELFFRGLLLRSVERRLGGAWAVVISGVAFGVTHFEALQTPALIAFGIVLGLLVLRTGRLGTSIITHMAFNATTVVVLVRHW